MNRRELLIYIASFVMLLLLVGLVAYLTFIPVPADNKDIIITVLGVILGGGAAAMPNLFGDKEEETEKLKSRIRSLEKEFEVLLAKYKEVSERYDAVLSMLINRHFIPSDPRLPPTLPREIDRFAKRME